MYKIEQNPQSLKVLIKKMIFFSKSWRGLNLNNTFVPTFKSITH